MSGEENARLRRGSELLFRIQVMEAVTEKEQASPYWNSAVEGAVGACLAIEDDFVRSGLSRQEAQNRTSTILGGRKVKDLVITLMTILGKGDPLSSEAENSAHAYPRRYYYDMK